MLNEIQRFDIMQVAGIKIDMNKQTHLHAL